MELTKNQQCEIIEDWSKNLRSGEYEQGKYQLKYEGKYCCLGVLADVLSKRGIGKWGENVFYLKENDRSSICLNDSVTNLLGFPGDIYDKDRTPLWKLNDSENYTFTQIADVIDEQILPKYKE